MTKTQTPGPQVTGKCRKGHIVTGLWEDTRMGWITCPCGSQAMARSLKVTYREDVPCSAKCTSAFGPSCSCSCRGKNHSMDRRF